MIKILFAINNLNIGGAERLVLSQLRDLNGDDDIEGYLLTTLPDSENNFAADAFFLGDRLVRFRFRGLWDIISLWKLTLFLKKRKFDAVITNLFFTNCVVRAAAAFAGAPVILSYEHNVYADKKRWQIIIDKILSYFTDRIIAVSQAVLDFTSEQEKIPREKFTLIYNGIRLSGASSPSKDAKQLKELLAIPAGTLIVSTAGRLVKQKGHIYLIQAADLIKKLHPNLKLQILIFGNGALKEQLKEKISEFALKDVVQMPGVWPMADILELSDVFVLSSLWEGLPMTLLESFAAGKPAIATDIIGVSELIEDGISGFLVKPRDAESLANKIVLLLNDKRLRQRVGFAAKRRAADFAIEKNVAKIKHLALSLLKEKKRYE